MIKLKFTPQIVGVPVKKEKDEPENPMVKKVRIRPDLEARYDKGLISGLSKMCSECTGWMNDKCETPKKKDEVRPGQRPCREYNLDGRLCGVTEAETRQAEIKEKIEHKKEIKKPKELGKKSLWQEKLERWFKEKKIPNPDFMNTKRWAYWESLKKNAPISVLSASRIAKPAVNVKTKTRRKV